MNNVSQYAIWEWLPEDIFDKIVLAAISYSIEFQVKNIQTDNIQIIILFDFHQIIILRKHPSILRF